MKISLYIQNQIRFKNWSNELGFTALQNLPTEELTKHRQTTFKNILGTLNHIYVVEDIFKAHLKGQKHSYKRLSAPIIPTLDEIMTQQRIMDQWYLDYARSLSEDQLHEKVSFQFQDGTDGLMSRLEILTHIVTHDTFHKGFVNEMVYKVPTNMPNNDYPVFVREVLNKE